MKKFDPKSYIAYECCKMKREIIGSVLAAVSGGVDSSVSASLLKKAGIPCELLFIDTGFLREKEPVGVPEMLKRAGLEATVLDAKERFYSAMKNKVFSKDKREAFRNTYFACLCDYAKNEKIGYIAQGTQFHNSSAKVYHNCPGKLLSSRNIKLIEPVRSLNKTQIRSIAKELELPSEIINRRPFPGPGLLIRFGGAYSKGKLILIRKATYIIDAFFKKYPVYFNGCYQIFPFLEDGSEITYVKSNKKGGLGNAIIVRSVKQNNKGNSVVFEPFIIDLRIQGEIVKKLMEVLKIARVYFDLTPKYGFGNNLKPGGTIEYA